MVNPQTVNIGLIVPLTGADVDTWGANDVNPNMSSLDGLFGGVQTIGLSNVPVTLTAPAAFVPTPGGGPTQAQNRVLRFTGTLTANVTVTLPLPGSYLIENRTTDFPNVLSLRAAGVGEVVGFPPGETIEVYCDGTNVRFVGMGRVAAAEMWAGFIGMPSWVGSCTVPPYLYCDGTVYNIATYPALGRRLLGQFGGNGITTFAVPDLRGRVPLAYDGTGARITVAGCGINGQTIGAALDQQTVLLAVNQIPSLTSVNPAQAINVNGTAPGRLTNGSTSFQGFTGGTPINAFYADTGAIALSLNSAGNNSISVAYTNTAQQAVNNVQPSLVTGVWAIKT